MDLTSKRLFDVTVLVVSHLVLLPLWATLWAVISLAIKLEDRGPIFYGQKRAGKDGHAFTLLKFRTMVPGADRLGPAWTSENDARITRVGRVLRRTAMDELPGLLAIWKGDMSFVGPRALDAGEHKWLEGRVPRFAERLRVRPGLTGLAQVYNRDDAPDTKIIHDLDYIRTMGPLLDIKLMLLSLRNTLLGRWDSRSGKARHDDGIGPGDEPS